MLDNNTKNQLSSYLGRVSKPLEIVASLDDSSASQEMLSLLNDIKEACLDKITLKTDGIDARSPSFALVDSNSGHECVRFAGLPLGHEFTSLVLALLWTGGHPPKEDPLVIESIIRLQEPMRFEVYMSLSCHNCPDVVQALALMACLNPKITTTVIEGSLFQGEVNDRGIMAVPSVFLNGKPFASGRMSLADILEKLGVNDQSAINARLNETQPFDVLVIGGGPAGAAAAVYAARKGIRTGIIAERFGGQVNDTMSIENYISVLQTDGPQFAKNLAAQIRHYDVQTIEGQTVENLAPRGEDGLLNVQLKSGSILQAKSVIIATGARWRALGVEGESQYKGAGVNFCPHCDGPLYKGKKVIVVGGGNSGVEAAIDLAGIASHVTLLEYSAGLKADAVLVRKAQSIDNITIVTHAKTTQVIGDGKRVTAIKYQDLVSMESSEIVADGIFVQIGLVPNTEWLGNSMERTPHGEILVDPKGATSLAGVFAAGDCTTTPYKQIVIAAGEGAKAALSAFDFLIRR